MSNMVALQTLELVEAWKFGRWEISGVSLYSYSGTVRVQSVCGKRSQEHFWGWW